MEGPLSCQTEHMCGRKLTHNCASFDKLLPGLKDCWNVSVYWI